MVKLTAKLFPSLLGPNEFLCLHRSVEHYDHDYDYDHDHDYDYDYDYDCNYDDSRCRNHD